MRAEVASHHRFIFMLHTVCLHTFSRLTVGWGWGEFIFAVLHAISDEETTERVLVKVSAIRGTSQYGSPSDLVYAVQWRSSQWRLYLRCLFSGDST